MARDDYLAKDRPTAGGFPDAEKPRSKGLGSSQSLGVCYSVDAYRRPLGLALEDLTHA